MADALCGPSNALQSFQKHTQVDRTLQQDRLTGARHSPAQGFRSFDPRTGSLDADFHAFENAAPSPFQFQDPSFSTARHGPLPFQQAPQPQNSGWAADFSRLNISEQPIPAHQFRAEVPLVKSVQGGWQNEFMRHREGYVSPVAQGKSVVFDPVQEPSYGMSNAMQYQMPQMGSFMPQPNMTQFHEQSAQHQDQQLSNSSAADWSQAFEEAYSSAMESEKTSIIGDEQMLHQDGVYTNDHTQDSEAYIQEPENIRIGSDAIQYKEIKDRTADHEQHDSNALARVAGELLHNVQSDSSEKFQNSQFLDLMRKIRDKQVEIRNNEFETTGTDTFRSGTGATSTWESQAASQAEHASQSNQGSFQFPDLNSVYEPNVADFTDYSFDPDDYSSHYTPQSQIQELHPGGKLYPGSMEQGNAHMSGAIGPYPVDEFDKVDESRSFASRYQRPSVGPDPDDGNVA